MNVCRGSVESCVNILKEEKMIIVSPGGAHEALFGDSNYELMWKKRIGFAKIALESKAPIIPIFTENVREAYIKLKFADKLIKWTHNLTKIPLNLIIGTLPVKLRAYLGKPITYDPNLTPEELQQKVARALEDLIAKNQRIPGNVFDALLDRFREKQPVDIKSNLKNQRIYTFE
jgi:1-acyl-sn-glycerol-3-phosphate acyltransferase